MMTIEEIRRKNLSTLIAEAGNATKLSAKIDKSPSHISQLLKGSPDSKTGKPRGMGDDTCRELEEKCGKERGWMDNVHSEVRIPAIVSPDKLINLIELYGKMDEINRAELITFAKGAVALGVTREPSDTSQNDA